MSQHTSAVFNNSCLKVPINPFNKLPSPAYEQKHIHQLKNQALKSNSVEKENQTMKTKKTSANSETLQSLIDFYDSIPDYNDINHLSNQEFYRRIEHLKAKQKSYYEYLDAELTIENKVENFVEDYKKQASGERSSSRKSDTFKNNHKIWDNIRSKATPETDSVSSFGKEIPVAPPSRRSVRIESPKSEIESKLSEREFTSKSQRNVSSAGSKDSSKSVYLTSDNPWDDVYNKTNELLINSGRNTSYYTTKSLPNSPIKQKPPAITIKDCGITIPKPFQMTIRDEEEKIVNDILSKTPKPKSKKPEMFKAHPVPIESQIPLFDKIMEDQEIRRQIVKLQSKEELLSKMKPFSFTRREEEMNNMCSRFSKSTPQLCPQLSSAYDEPELNIKPFKAKPVPKNLFSNYVYRKMHEDEFYRALKKKIRAEEMLKASSLPPSMAKREKSHKPHNICPRSYRYLETPDYETNKKTKSKQIPDFEIKHDQLNLELEDLKNDFISTTPRPFKFQTAKRHEKKRCRSAKKCYRASEYENIEMNKRAQSALELQSVNRSNLAAVLRIQSARLSDLNSVPTPRKRMEQEMCRRLEEQKLKEESRWREKVMRQRPVWQELNYSHEEELAMRLQMRKEEERLREQEHRQHMEIMHGRVQQMPTLFERQSQAKAPQTRKELMQAFYDEINYSPLSNKKNGGTLSQNGSPDSNDWDKLEKALYNDIAIQTSSSNKQDELKNNSCECSDED